MKIVAAAIRLDGCVFTGVRHGEIIGYLIRLGFPPPIIGEQGFMDDQGQFHDREESGKIAIAAGQIDKLKWPGMGLDSIEVFPRR